MLSLLGRSLSVPFGQSASQLRIDGVEQAADGSIRVSLVSELDRDESEYLLSGVADVVQRYAPATISIDATRLTFLDSAGIRALLTCRKLAERAGCRLSMPRVHLHVFQVLEISGLLGNLGVLEQTAPNAAREAPGVAGRSR
ncbi:STAS domain-containing protein [Actinoplanes sp. CA-030573]|uniref:STAS domain-containing protein n=1 Tax=Actinoplanes sp. CA-030573 TaxID=3239898 RepID=UPI003D8A69C9